MYPPRLGKFQSMGYLFKPTSNPITATAHLPPLPLGDLLKVTHLHGGGGDIAASINQCFIICPVSKSQPLLPASCLVAVFFPQDLNKTVTEKPLIIDERAPGTDLLLRSLAIWHKLLHPS